MGTGSRQLRPAGTGHSDRRSEVVAQTLEAVDSLEDLRSLEAFGAGLYWALWEQVPVNFARRERVIPRWMTFGSRLSPLTGSARRAATPGNAILNYLYSMLASETTVALHVVGLDPGLGILHADKVNRD